MSVLLNLFITLLILPWGSMAMMSPMMFGGPGASDNLRGILMVSLFLSYPVILFVVLGLLRIRFWGFDSFAVAGIAAIGSIAVIVFLGIPGMLMNLKRGIPNDGYGLVDGVAYYSANPIAGSDGATFRVLDMIPELPSWRAEYALDQHHFYWHGKPVEGVDPVNIHLVELNGQRYWMNDHQVIVDRRIVKDANPATFAVFPEYSQWAHSETGGSHTVYHDNTPLEGVDFESFQPVNWSFGKDNQRVYYGNNIVFAELDPGSFEAISNHFVKDQHGIYALRDDQLSKLDGVDSTTFEELNYPLARDQDHLYFYNDERFELIDGVNPDQLVDLERGYYRVRNSILYVSYRGVIRMDNADTDSFEVMDIISDLRFDARDKHQQYHFGEPLPKG
ncbi:DKNYY domain-containing protein [Oceanobacter mangrovi]|uniref:DKNYY domain-containing protein n=1 Tax=Oceanobacter mangrovi TaxID=2862510 RepID=UPI001C8D779F|nr:DKNYY domain-containing protein [Oceanobacter mangrovi]